MNNDFLKEREKKFGKISEKLWKNFYRAQKNSRNFENISYFFWRFNSKFWKAGYRRLVRSPWNVLATRKHARNETSVEVYSCCGGHFTRQISYVSHLEPFCERIGKITKSKGFSRENINLKENTDLLKKVCINCLNFYAHFFGKYKNLNNQYKLFQRISYLSSTAASL